MTQQTTEQPTRAALDKQEKYLVEQLKALAMCRLDVGDNPGFNRATDAWHVLDPLWDERP